jgi:L-ascorbate metabolism protein UlaG (beta-lactamase superfamily)
MAQIRWLGHAGFKISFPDKDHADTIRNIYIDTWLDNPKIPADFKGTVPDDADLILVTHGHFDHCGSAPDILKKSKHSHCKVMVNYEIGHYF